ncbi:hypothetical protein BDZ94DRAFT_1249105 [Collybia nuda]|uniref:Uncharacterized protein n=1 Tax=Collybia nuda TaxID=64659 RepID=A0A9P6CNU7_9AGAR|nr:hypothetical protein BDZ94DRAFT_1249105 [Collybia nuda]
MSEIFDINGSAYTIAAYMRVASMAISLYDYLETLPTAWKFYKEHYKTRRISLSAVLFVLIRATSVLVLTISNVGFFYGHFTPETCRKFYLLPPTFKVLQVMVSQAILGIRAWNLSRRSRVVCYFLLCVYTTSTVLQWITSIHQREPRIGLTTHHNCRAYNPRNDLGAWTYYAIAVVYDFATTGISIVYLLKYKLTSNSSMMSKLTRMMLYDGVGYFFALTAVNILNLILYKGSAQNIQTAGASLAYCVSWIMSQRLLIHLYDVSRERRNDSINEAITITQNLESARDVARAIRTQFEQKTGNGFELTVPDFDLSTHHEMSESHEGGVQVRIEHTVKLDRRLRTFELENYSRTGRHSRETQSRR